MPMSPMDLALLLQQPQQGMAQPAGAAAGVGGGFVGSEMLRQKVEEMRRQQMMQQMQQMMQQQHGQGVPGMQQLPQVPPEEEIKAY